MSFHIIIPARYHSSRFPGKVLAELKGKPILQHVFEVAQKTGAESVVVATEDEKVKKVAESFGATVCMTSDTHETGTERIAEVVDTLEYDDEDIIIGLQADEPFVPASVVKQLANELEEHDNVKVASLCQELTNIEDLFNPHITKVVLNRRKHAMYFSRAPIPFERDNFTDGKKPKALTGKHYRHIGIYGYRADFLEKYVEMDECPAEQMEKLEQLRFLWEGVRIQMLLVKDNIPAGIDTEEDLRRASQ